MCRMLGIVAMPSGEEPTSNPKSSVSQEDRSPVLMPSWKYLVGAKHSLREQAYNGNVPVGVGPGHEDSWGVGWFDAAGQVSLIRHTGSAAHSAFFVFAAESAARGAAGSGPGRILIAHLRKARVGAISSENAHPIRVDYRRNDADTDLIQDARPYATLLIAHNGTIRDPLLARLRESVRRDEAQSDSDSVVLSGWIAEEIAQDGEPGIFHHRLARALQKLLAWAGSSLNDEGWASYTGLNLLIAHDTGLYALRQFNRNADYYTLFKRPLDAEDVLKGWVVASEPTDTNPDWEPLMSGQLLWFPKDGTPPKAVSLI